VRIGPYSVFIMWPYLDNDGHENDGKITEYRICIPRWRWQKTDFGEHTFGLLYEWGYTFGPLVVRKCRNVKFTVSGR
jgi:hypothetical protein